MKGAPYLAWRHVVRHRLRTALLVSSVALIAMLPIAIAGLLRSHGESLRARAEATPMLIGSAGEPLQLVFGAMLFRDGATLRPIPRSTLSELAEFGLAVPLHVRFAARGRPIVATSPEYFEVRGLHAARGTLPLRLGDAVLGADVADALDMDVGAQLFSDPARIHDLRQPPSLALRVVGVLARAGTPDDGAVFADLSTAWVLEGLMHGHAAAGELEGDAVSRRDGARTLVSPAAIPHDEVTPANIDTFHAHGDPGAFPLSAALVVPRDRAAATILAARLEARGELQAARPGEVVSELLDGVLRVRRLFDGILGLVSLVTLALLVGYLGLTLRLRRAEAALMTRLGASRGLLWRMVACEWGGILMVGLGLGAAAGAVLVALSPDLLGWWDRLG